jgi:hypothetical protein
MIPLRETRTLRSLLLSESDTLVVQIKRLILHEKNFPRLVFFRNNAIKKRQSIVLCDQNQISTRRTAKIPIKMKFYSVFDLYFCILKS